MAKEKKLTPAQKLSRISSILRGTISPKLMGEEIKQNKGTRKKMMGGGKVHMKKKK